MSFAEWPNVQERERLLALEDFHRGYLPCTTAQQVAELTKEKHVPLIILQKMQAAAIVVLSTGQVEESGALGKLTHRRWHN